ncbi:MAG: hypothetical protein ACREO0_10915 [Pseudoxanthomonas sp.]
MKALTLIRPWAWAIVASTKRIENRTWKADYIVGKRIAIHAGAKVDERACVQIENFHGSVLPASARDMGIVGTAIVTGFVTRSHDRWFCGPIGWTLEDVIRLPEPIPCKGAQGLWNIPPDVLRKIP